MFLFNSHSCFLRLRGFVLFRLIFLLAIFSFISFFFVCLILFFFFVFSLILQFDYGPPLPICLLFRQCSFIPLTISTHNGRIGLQFRLRTAAFSIFTSAHSKYYCVLLVIADARARAAGSRLWRKQVELREK